MGLILRHFTPLPSDELLSFYFIAKSARGHMNVAQEGTEARNTKWLATDIAAGRRSPLV